MTKSKRYLTNNRYDEYRKAVDCIHDYRSGNCSLNDLALTLLHSCDLVNSEINADNEFCWQVHTDSSKLERNDAIHAELCVFSSVIHELRGYFKREMETGPGTDDAFIQFPELTNLWINFLVESPEDRLYFTGEYYSWLPR